MSKYTFTHFVTGLVAVLVLACGARPAPVRVSVTAHESLNSPDTISQQPGTPDNRAPAVAVNRDTTSTVKAPPSLPADVTKTFPDASTIRDVGHPFPCRIIENKAGVVLGYIADSDSAGTTADGYAGPVPVRVYLDSAARPRRVLILDNRETPAYLELVVSDGLLERLLQYDPVRPESVDAVTLATTSSKALIHGVTATADRVAADFGKR